jgi:hypothetical protein
MLGLLQLAFTFIEDVCWKNILELFQGYDSNPLNAKEFVHQAWLHMIKLNTPTHEFEKSNIGDKQENNMFKK